MKDYFNWIGCKSSKKERYIQPYQSLFSPQLRCKSSKKERYIQLCVVILNTTFDVNHLEEKGTFNCFCVVIMFLDENHLKIKATFNYSC